VLKYISTLRLLTRRCLVTDLLFYPLPAFEKVVDEREGNLVSLPPGGHTACLSQMWIRYGSEGGWKEDKFFSCSAVDGACGAVIG
jgi:hypothetical protein